MSVDLDAIAQRGRCDVSSLKLALPLLEQGYTPPFLARYRRDELGGLDESTLWSLFSAVQTQQQTVARREDLHQRWQQTTLQDPSIGQAISKSNSLRMLARLGRRLKSENTDNVSDASRLAVRVLNPQKGDGDDFAAIAAKVEGITDAGAAVAGLEEALATRLAGDPRVISAAVRWLVKNAKIHIANISDPHTPPAESTKSKEKAAKPTEQATAESATVAESAPAADAQPASESTETPAATEPVASEPAASEAVAETATTEAAAAEPANSQPASAEPETENAKASAETATTTETETKEAETAATDASEPTADASKSKPKPASEKQAAPKAAAKKKKVSPRQRRRRWLVSVLKPLAGKRFNSDKLSSFQVVMLSRALRSQVAECSFEYDASKLVAELQRSAAGINRHIEDKLRDLVIQHEANIREAAEAAWWEDLQERASSRLVTITSDHLRAQVNRGGLDAKVVMAIDAVGPRTAATTIVAADGRVLHSEDLPCQLSAAQRTQAVAKMGELIHAHHVDLIVVSNGPARRATLVVLGDLIAQSPEKSIRWTLADRSGADAYSSSATADQEMRSTPRRFRSAAWLAFSVLQPAQALAKVDPLKLRLSSFQRELTDESLKVPLNEVMSSGASRGGVDVNSAPISWLSRLPGMNDNVAQAIDKARREELFTSRESVNELDDWDSSVSSRQALPFLRVFQSEEPLDGTLIHPEDYALAKKLAANLEIELPPNEPPGYQKPDFSSEKTTPEPAALVETETEAKKAEVEDFTSAGEKASEFALDGVTDESAETATPESTPGETSDGSKPETDQPEASADSEAATEPEADAETASTEEPSEQAPAEPESSDEPSGESVAADSAAAQNNDATPELEEAKPEAAAPATVPDPIKRTRPDKAKIDKCIKEWQIGSRRANQLVNWLCDPFGDSDVSGHSPAVLATMPSTKALKEGDSVIGVVVGVMPFGVFVELAPDCSGLIHVSRVSESYVEDLHEAVQVGDVVTAWVTGIDQKRRRVGLSAISPERAASLEKSRTSQNDSRRGGPRRGGNQSRDSGTASGQASRGGQSRSGGNQQDKGKRTGGPPRGKDGGGRGKGQRSGGGRRDNRGRGGQRDRKLESYRVVGKKESKPLTDAMQEGKEPLRSFGDLMQFFDKPAEIQSEKEKPAKSKPVAEDPKPSSEETQPVTEPKAEQASPDQTTPAQETPPDADQATSSSEASAESPDPPKADTSTT